MEAKKILVITNDDDVFAKLHFEFDANKYGILPRAELKRLAKIYDDINNEGYAGGNFNPYRSCYVSQERYDSFMKSYNTDKASIEKELSELQY